MIILQMKNCQSYDYFFMINMLQELSHLLSNKQPLFEEWLEDVTEMVLDMSEEIFSSIEKKLCSKVTKRMIEIKSIPYKDYEERKIRNFLRSLEQKRLTLTKNYVYLNQCLLYLRKQLNLREEIYSPPPSLKKNDSSYLTSLQENKLQFPNPRCLSCCRFFYKGWQVPHFRMVESPYLFVATLEEKQNIIKSMCGLLNLGGGEVLIGVDPEQKIVLGVQLTEQQKKNIQNLDYDVGPGTVLQIEPPLKNHHGREERITVSFLPVFSKLIGSGTTETNNGQFVIRIKVTPQKGKTYYLAQRRKGFHTIYIHPFIEKNSLIIEEGQKIYQKLISSYFKVKRRKGEHYHIDHTLPENGIFLEKKQPQKESIKAKTCIQFKHRNQNLIVVGSKSKVSRIETFSDTLVQNKVVHTITQPFLEHQLQNSRQIFLLSFEGKRVKPKQLANSRPKGQQISYYQIEKNIKVHQITSDNLSIIKKKFLSQNIGGLFEFSYEQKKGKRFYGVEFSIFCLDDSILLFSLLQLYGVRSIFSKESK